MLWWRHWASRCAPIKRIRLGMVTSMPSSRQFHKTGGKASGVFRLALQIASLDLWGAILLSSGFPPSFTRPLSSRFPPVGALTFPFCWGTPACHTLLCWNVGVMECCWVHCSSAPLWRSFWQWSGGCEVTRLLQGWCGAQLQSESLSYVHVKISCSNISPKFTLVEVDHSLDP